MEKWINALERKFGRFAIPNLTFTLLMAQVATVGLALFGQISPIDMVLNSSLVLDGDWWRLITFMILPRITAGSVDPLSILFTAFALYIFYFMGTALEQIWQAFKFNLFIFLGWVFTVLASFVVPMGFMTNTFLLSAFFLAFARYHGEMQFLIMFIIPVKVKWLAWFTWGLFAFTLFVGPFSQKLEVLAAIAPLALFFGRDLFGSVQAQVRSQKWKRQKAAEAAQPMHTCVVCGKTDISHPDELFRYDGGYAFCEEHIDESEKYLSEKAGSDSAG